MATALGERGVNSPGSSGAGGRTGRIVELDRAEDLPRAELVHRSRSGQCLTLRSQGVGRFDTGGVQGRQDPGHEARDDSCDGRREEYLWQEDW